MYKLPTSPPPCGEGSNQVLRRERKYHGCGKGIKGIGKQYHLRYNIKAVGKNIKWVREEGD